MNEAARAAHRADVEAWRAGRYERLRQPLGWLSLVGLEWLAEGDNRLGSDPGMDLRLSSGPAFAGTLRLRQGRVTAHAADGSALTSHGEAPDGLALVSDADASADDGPTMLELGTLRMSLIRRGHRLGLRVWDISAPAREDFEGVPHYPVDPAWALPARLERSPAGTTIALSDVRGGVSEEASPGTVAFEIGDITHRLRALRGGDQSQLWLIFADETNGDTTYGGGRYLYTDPVSRDGRVTVDFNRAYNPPCVFSPYATCPLPPPDNRLPVRIEAGERVFGAH